MKSIITLTLIIFSLACFGQAPTKKEFQAKVSNTGSPDNPAKYVAGFNSKVTHTGTNAHLQFSAFEKGEMADFDATQKQLIKIFRSQDSLKAVFLQKFLVRNGVDLGRISQHQDSLKITAEGIEYILKSKNK